MREFIIWKYIFLWDGPASIQFFLDHLGRTGPNQFWCFIAIKCRVWVAKLSWLSTTYIVINIPSWRHKSKSSLSPLSSSLSLDCSLCPNYLKDVPVFENIFVIIIPILDNFRSYSQFMSEIIPKTLLYARDLLNLLHFLFKYITINLVNCNYYFGWWQKISHFNTILLYPLGL